MKRFKSVLVLLMAFLLLFENTVSHAQESSELPESEKSEEVYGRQWITGEALGEAVVLGENGIMPRSAAGSLAVITPGISHAYGTWSTREYSVATEEGTYLGFCAQPNKPSPNGTYTVSELNNNTIKALILCYIDPVLYSQIGKNIFNEADNNTYAYCHAAIGYAYTADLTGLSASMASGVKWMVSVINQILNGTGDYVDSPATALLNSYLPRYSVYIAYNDAQDIVWAETARGSLEIQKTSSQPEITSENRSYSLKGAVYGVYRQGGDYVTPDATIVTDENGYGKTEGLPVGNYWIKEINAPEGFLLDDNWYPSYSVPVTVTKAAVATINVSDIPQTVSADILLEKIDLETGKNEPQGRASLENAEFTINYYDVLSETDPASDGNTPVKTWIVKTDEQGYSRVDDSYKVSGDEFFRINNIPVLPLGTITVQETKAPEGYMLNSEIYVIQLKGAENEAEELTVYNPLVIPENILKLNIKKVEKDTDIAIAGAVFRHTLPDGSMEEVTTDENGQAELKGLTYGVHTVQEIFAPSQYEINPGVVIFEVSEQNQITELTNTSVDETGVISFSQNEDGGAQLMVENTLAFYELCVYKKNQTGACLQGAEFTLYSDEGCTEVIETKSSDENGIVRFSGLVDETDYYLKETKAPKGYQILTDEEGNEHVYKIRAERDFAEGSLEYFVNDEKHIEQNMESADMQNTDNRILNITVINRTGIEMPNTGSGTNIFMMICGAVCMLSELLYMMTKRKNEDKDI